ncbi:MAG: O-antigen ligase family protein [Solirubrobacteraceae bacterium]
MTAVADLAPPAPPPPPPPPAPAPAAAVPRDLDRLADRAVTAAVALVLCLLAFVAQGGVALGPNTWAEVLLVLGGAALGAAALALPHRLARDRPLHGGRVLGLFGVLAALTALSITWSYDPATSWLETNRTLAYLAAFGGALAFGRLAPGRWDSVVKGIGIASVIVCAYALATKAFPEWLAEEETAARLRAPFGYWNAVGLTAALGVPPMLWLAARRSGHGARNALAYPALGVLLVCVLMAYSRGALLALILGLAFWFAVVPLRLRAAVPLVAAIVTTAGVIAYAFSQGALSDEDLEAAARADAGAVLGVLLIAQAIVLMGIGLVTGFAASLRPPAARTRTLAGRVLVGAVVVALVGAVAAVASGEGGIGGQIEKLTDPDVGTPANSPSRLTATSSVRARYWDEALDVHAAEPWLGAGAGAFGTARGRFRTGSIDVEHAHGYIAQTLADLGWVGLAASLAAMLAWLAAAAGVLGLRTRRREDRDLAWDAERVGMATLATVVLVFGIHSAIDWTWFIPANAVAALLCAGFLVARPPLVGRMRDEGPTGVIGAAERAGILPASRRFDLRERLAAWRPSPHRTVLAVGVLGIAMATCWSIVQPLRAENAYDAVTNRLAAGEYAAAADIARIAQQRNPLSVDPWFALAAARAAQGDERATALALVQAVRTQPANADAWQRLGEYQGSSLDDPDGALKALQAAYYLDPQAPGLQSAVLEAARAAEAPTP